MVTPQETLPERLGGYEYWSRQMERAPAVALLRRPWGGGREQVLLDCNDPGHVPHGCELGQVQLYTISSCLVMAHTYCVADSCVAVVPAVVQ